jgi:hypothetical protein
MPNQSSIEDHIIGEHVESGSAAQCGSNIGSIRTEKSKKRKTLPWLQKTATPNYIAALPRRSGRTAKNLPKDETTDEEDLINNVFARDSRTMPLSFTVCSMVFQRSQ